MAKPLPSQYKDILAEYQSGLCSVGELAKKYKVNRTALYDYIRKNNIKINNNIKQSIETIDKGLNELTEAKNEIINNQGDNLNTERQLNALNKGLDYLEARHGELAKGVIALVTKGFKKSNEMFDIIETPEQLQSVMRSIKLGSDTLGLFPKSPLVAIQQNINKEVNQNIGAKNIQVNINFVKKDKENEIIDAEIKE